MKYLILFLCMIKMGFASIENEILLNTAKIEGTLVYQSCILVPPMTSSQVAYCTTIYTKYTSTLALLNAPDPMLPTKDISPYSYSPFDVCKYEVTHMVFSIPGLGAIPYCPTVPVI